MSSPGLSTHVEENCPSVVLTTSPDSGRGLLAARSFEPGQLIFAEKPLLHTAHPVAHALGRSPASTKVNLAHDWQRLLHLYAHLQRAAASGVPPEDDDPPNDLLVLAMAELSTAGVTSDASRAADAKRADDYHESAREWVKRYKEGRKKKAVAKRKKKAASGAPEPQEQAEVKEAWTLTVEEIERLIAILETNSHSRDEDDQRDLEDPLAPSPPSRRSRGDSPGSDSDSDEQDHDDEKGKDEACGLWLVTSLVNHSCLPNCTIYIPSSRASGGPPELQLRCIRPIAEGAELFVSYHDEEFVPGPDRTALLAARGFTCRCPLCAGEVREYARAAACPACGEGICCPQRIDGEEKWACDRCDTCLDAGQQVAVREKEEETMALWQLIVEMTSGTFDPTEEFLPFKLLLALKARAADPTITPSNFLDNNFLDTIGIAPLHLGHGHIYAFLKYVLFEESIWLRSELHDAAVTGVLFAMAAIAERSLGPDTASEERRVLGYWMAKHAHDRLDARVRREDKARWLKVRDEGYRQWQAGMKTLYGRE